MLPVAAAAQEALQSALSIDPMLRENASETVPPGPDRHHIGAAQFTLGASATVAYSDNISGAEFSPEADTWITTGVSLGIQWPLTGQSTLSFGMGVSYVKYLHVTSNDGLAINPNSALVYAVSAGDITLSVFDQVAYFREALTQGALANVTTLPRLDNTAGMRVSWTPGHWNLETGYSHNNVIAENAADEYLNSDSEYFFGRAGWMFPDSSTVGVEASGSLTDYSAGLEPNNQSVSIGPYVEWRPRPWLRLDARGGPSWQFFDAFGVSPESTLNSYYVFADVTHQLADFLSHHLSIERSVQPGLNPGSSYVEQLEATYTVSWALTHFVTLSGTLDYQDGNQPLPIPLGGGFTAALKENYTVWSGGPSIAWKLTDALTASANYNRSWRDSNLPGRSYTVNSVSLNLTYTF